MAAYILILVEKGEKVDAGSMPERVSFRLESIAFRAVTDDSKRGVAVGSDVVERVK